MNENPPVSSPLEFPSYKPTGYYFRQALREASTTAEAVEVGMQAVREIESLKEWIRDQGMIPPRRFILSTEAEDKGLIPFSSPAPEKAS